MASEQTLTTFETRVRQMLLHYQALKKENAELYEMLSQQEEQVKELQAQVKDLNDDQQRLRMAKMLTITDGGLEQAKARLNALIREVNKCIVLLKEAK